MGFEVLLFLCLIAALSIQNVALDGNEIKSCIDNEEKDGNCNNQGIISLVTDNKVDIIHQIEELKRKVEFLEQKLMKQDDSPWSRGITYLLEMYRTAENTVVKSLPQSDQQCYFNWKIFGCSPHCLCEWKPQFGDVSFDRGCRLRSEATTCELNTTERNNIQLYTEKLVSVVNNSINGWLGKVKENAPYSDNVCHWSFKKLSCVPSTLCELDFQLGDYTFNRACRIITDKEFSSDEIRSALLEDT